MNLKTFFAADKAYLVGCVALLATLTGCVTEGSYHSRGYRSSAEVQVQTAVAFEDDYDYYPGYETYYSRSRREFVYRDGRTWVRRSEPRGISVDLFLAAPSVRMEFRDSPERHHRQVVRTYPKRWTPPNRAHDNRGDRRAERKNDRDDGRKDDRKHDRKDDGRRN